MKIRINRFISLVLSLSCCAFLAAACSDWTEQETVGLEIDGPKDQDPAQYAAYMKALRAYKQSDHIRTYGRLKNAPETSVSEKDFLRSLPDSLDFAAFFNSDDMTPYDIEDIPVVQEKGTRVLYYIDYDQLKDRFADNAALDGYIDGVLAKIAKYGLDGAVLAGNPVMGDGSAAQQAASRLLVDKLAAVAGPAANGDKALLFEGDPTFLADTDRNKFDYFVLSTADYDNVSDMLLLIREALDVWGLPASKLFLSTDPSSTILSVDQAKVGALTEVAHLVLSEGPLAGLGIYDIGSDYYDPTYTYKHIGGVIALLNASPKN